MGKTAPKNNRKRNIKLRRTYKYRLYHCGKRTKHLHQQINVAGIIWNHGVALQRRYYRLTGQYISLGRLKKPMAKLRKRTHRYGYWRELGSQAVQDVLERLDKAYWRFFAGKAGRPRFKRVRKYSSFTLKQSSWKQGEDGPARGSADQSKCTGHITILGYMYRFVKHRPLKGTIKTVTIKRDRCNRLWVCFSVIEDYDVPETVSMGEIGGFDFGLKTFLVDQHNRSYRAHEYFRSALTDIRHLHRQFSRKQAGSNNQRRAKRRLAQGYEQVAHRRWQDHFDHAHQLCDRYDILIFEDLNLDGMKRLWGRKVSDLGFYQFLKIVEHVARKRGKQVLTIDRFEPTSQTCSCCGHRQPMPLRERTFVCEQCGLVIDRDHNAARNIARVGASILGLGDVRPDSSGDSA